MGEQLAYTQFLIFELGTECNLGKLHTKCPNSLGVERYAGLDCSKSLEDETIIAAAVAAYRDHGFTGMVGWHYYNEPSLQKRRMLSLMGRISAEIQQARYVLWTNGTVAWIREELTQFQSIHQSLYSITQDDNRQLDGRMDKRPMQSDHPCLRVYVEFILDAFGNHHPCCYDWRGEASLGNVYGVGFPTLVDKWENMQKSIGQGRMTQDSPWTCKICGYRWAGLQILVPDVAQRIKNKLAVG